MYQCEVSLFSGSRLWPTSMLVKRTHSCFKLNKKINKNKKMFSCVFFIVIKGRRSHTSMWKGFKSECSWLTEASTSELSASIRYNDFNIQWHCHSQYSRVGSMLIYSFMSRQGNRWLCMSGSLSPDPSEENNTITKQTNYKVYTDRAEGCLLQLDFKDM